MAYCTVSSMLLSFSTWICSADKIKLITVVNSETTQRNNQFVSQDRNGIMAPMLSTSKLLIKIEIREALRRVSFKIYLK